MGHQPGADGLQRDLVERDLAAVGQHPADRHVGPAVLSGIAHPHHPPVVQQHPAGALDLQHEGIDRVGQPEDAQALVFERARLDGGAVPVRQQPAALQPADDGLAFQLGREGAEVGLHHVGGRAEQRRCGRSPPGLRAPRTSGS